MHQLKNYHTQHTPMLHDVKKKQTNDTYNRHISWYQFAKFFSERRCHLIGSVVQAGCCRAIVSYCRSQWNLTLDRAGACCQRLNLIPSSCSHWRALKKGLWPHGCASSISGQILILYSCIIREMLWVFVLCWKPILTHRSLVYFLKFT